MNKAGKTDNKAIAEDKTDAKSMASIKEKLKNPNMFVSKTRLSVHNMPKSCDEKTLREKLKSAVGKLGPIKQVGEAFAKMDRKEPGHAPVQLTHPPFPATSAQNCVLQGPGGRQGREPLHGLRLCRV